MAKQKMEKPEIVEMDQRERELILRQVEIEKKSIDLEIEKLKLEKEMIEYDYKDTRGELPILKCRGHCRGRGSRP